MVVAIMGSEQNVEKLKNLCANAENHEFIHCSFNDLLDIKVEALFDFEYENRVEKLTNYYEKANHVFINAVIEQGMIESRFNGWNSFYEQAPLEVVIKNEDDAKALEALGIKYKNVADVSGMLTPRVVSMIINEAYFALSENVSSKTDIDTAMKLGTNYPYGPFEWAEIIGVQKVYALLHNLAHDKRYLPAPALVKEINNN